MNIEIPGRVVRPRRVQVKRVSMATKSDLVSPHHEGGLDARDELDSVATRLLPVLWAREVLWVCQYLRQQARLVSRIGRLGCQGLYRVSVLGCCEHGIRCVIYHHRRGILSAIFGAVIWPFHLFWARFWARTFLVGIAVFRRGVNQSFFPEEYVSGAGMVVTDFVCAHTLYLMMVPKCLLVVEEGFGFAAASGGDEFHTPEKGNDRFCRLDDNFLHLFVHQIFCDPTPF